MPINYDDIGSYMSTAGRPVENCTIDSEKLSKLSALEPYANEYQDSDAWDVEQIQKLRLLKVVKEYQLKIDPYQKKIEAYKADYEKNRTHFKSQLDSYAKAIKGIKDRQRKRELKERYSEAVQLFEKYFTAMVGKFVKAGIASSKLRGSIQEFQEAVDRDDENVSELQQEVEKQFERFYDEGGRIKSRYWGGLDADSTEETLLKVELRSLGVEIEMAQRECD